MNNTEIKTDIWIEGGIERVDSEEIDLDKFTIELIEWAESKGYLFGGVTRYMTEEEI